MDDNVVSFLTLKALSMSRKKHVNGTKINDYYRGTYMSDDPQIKTQLTTFGGGGGDGGPNFDSGGRKLTGSAAEAAAGGRNGGIHEFCHCEHFSSIRQPRLDGSLDSYYKSVQLKQK